MRRPFFVVALAVLTATSVASCGGNEAEACSGGQAKLIQEREVDVAYRGPLVDGVSVARQRTSGLVLEVTNSQRSVERVRVSLDGEDALDFDVPGACGGSYNPVFSLLYDRPPGSVKVVLDLQGARSTSTIEVPAHGLVWAVVDVQSKREWGDITVYDRRPMWG